MVKINEARKISYEKAKEIRDLNLKGVYIGEDSKRYYPLWKLSFPCARVCRDR